MATNLSVKKATQALFLAKYVLKTQELSNNEKQENL